MKKVIGWDCSNKKVCQFQSIENANKEFIMNCDIIIQIENINDGNGNLYENWSFIKNRYDKTKFLRTDDENFYQRFIDIINKSPGQNHGGQTKSLQFLQHYKSVK